MIIYKITNKINNKSYVGQTIGNLIYRWHKHCNNSGCMALKSAIKKYGKENFYIEIVAVASSFEELNEMETYHILLHGTLSPGGYNLNTGGDSIKMSDETKYKLSLANSGSKNPHFGKERPKIVKLKISKKAKLRGTSGTLNAVNAKKKPIFCIEMQKMYASVSDASRDLGNIGTSNICKVLSGKIKHARGFTFKYVEKK